MHSFSKQVSEQYPVTVEFKDRLPTGVSLSSATVSAIDTSDNSDATSTVFVSSTATISGTQAVFTVKSGTDGRSYRITLAALLSNGGELDEEFLMTVANI